MVVAELVAKLGFKVNTKGLRKFGRAFSRQINKARLQLSNLRSAAFAVTAAIAASAATVGGILRIAGAAEQARIAFTAFTGSTELADDLLKDLTEFAAKTPFTISGIRTAAVGLKAMGSATEDILPTLKSLGDLAAGLPEGLGALPRLVFNLGQIRNQQRATTRDVREFANKGIPIYEALETVMGAAVGTGADLVKQGKVGFPEIQKAIALLTDEGGKFHNFMAKQNKSLFGQISNLKDRFEILGIEIGKNLLPTAKKYIKTAIAIIKANQDMIVRRATRFFSDLQKQLVGVVRVGKDFIAFVLNLIEGFGGLKNTILIIAGVWSLFNIQIIAVGATIIGFLLLLEDLFVAFKGGEAVTSPLIKPLLALGREFEGILDPITAELKEFFITLRSDDGKSNIMAMGRALLFMANSIALVIKGWLLLINVMSDTDEESPIVKAFKARTGFSRPVQARIDAERAARAAFLRKQGADPALAPKVNIPGVSNRTVNQNITINRTTETELGTLMDEIKNMQNQKETVDNQ